MNGKKNSPAFQFYAGDWLRDQTVKLMSLEERGAYITLLASCWVDGSVPNEPAKLARICDCSEDDMNRIWPALRPCFSLKKRNDESRLTNKRLESERNKQRKWRKRQSDSAKERWKQANDEQ